MKKLLMLVTICFLLLQVNAQETKVAITPKTSVIFPGQPTKTVQETGSTYVYFPKDTAFVCTMALVDMEIAKGVTQEAMVLAMLDTTFWDQVETGFMTSMGVGVVKRKRELRTINGQQALYMEVDRPDGTGTLDIAAMVMMEGKNSINLVHINKKGKDPGREKFFRSLEIKE